MVLTWIGSIPLDPDGFAFADARLSATEDEIVECQTCQHRFPLAAIMLYRPGKKVAVMNIRSTPHGVLVDTAPAVTTLDEPLQHAVRDAAGAWFRAHDIFETDGSMDYEVEEAALIEAVVHEVAAIWDEDTLPDTLTAIACTNVLHYAFTTFARLSPDERATITRRDHRLAWV